MVRQFAMMGAMLGLAGACWAAPQVQNGSFEADRYSKGAGLARGNGGTLTGWAWSGNAGLNPIWQDPQALRGPDSPFWDNGMVPEGKQIALIQGPGRISQKVGGFEKGRRYRVTYRENGRVQRRGAEWPRLRVLLGGQVVVSPHEVTPVAKAGDFSVPFYRVEGAEFVAPEGGAFELVLETVQQSGTTTVLIDDVRILAAK